VKGKKGRRERERERGGEGRGTRLTKEEREGRIVGAID
jgi:hypothetical protein